jgi:hypothetical protein
MVMDDGSQMQAETAATVSDAPVVPTRVTDDDGHIVGSFRCRPTNRRSSGCCGAVRIALG